MVDVSKKEQSKFQAKQQKLLQGKTIKDSDKNYKLNHYTGYFYENRDTGEDD